ncbi:mutator type transposase, partial [Tanacetum coccineum]
LGDDLDLTRDSKFTFMSDRHKGLIPLIAQVFPCVEHRVCLRHIHKNMKLQFKGDLYKEFLWNYASATSRAHCDMLLNNICEVFNKQLVDGRDVPIITCLEFVREYLMKRIVKVQQVIDKSKGPLTPATAVLFKSITYQASFYKVLWNGEDQYQVMGPYNDQCVVDVKEKTCSCRKWELTGMPCKHAVAALWDRDGNKSDVGIPESWVHACYWLVTWKKVYSYKINPLNGKDLWKKHLCPNTLTPPKFHPRIGRPPKKRKKSADELSSQKMTSGGKLSRVGKTVTCDTCKKPGHNKRSCKNGVGGSQPSQMSAAVGPQRSAATPITSQRGPVVAACSFWRIVPITLKHGPQWIWSAAKGPSGWVIGEFVIGRLGLEEGS